MSADVVDGTIGKLCETVKALARQATGEDDKKTFLDTLYDAFGKDKLKDILDEDFDTEWYNAEWVKLLGDDSGGEGGSEGKAGAKDDGVRLRAAVVYLSSWKRALMRLPGVETDVDRVYRSEFAPLNSGYCSLVHTRLKLAQATSSAGDSGGGNG